MHCTKSLIGVVSFLMVMTFVVPTGAPATTEYKLEASLAASPGVTKSGDSVTVTMAVTNPCCNTITSVTPSTLTVDFKGSASAVLTSGPNPTSKDIDQGKTETFTWVYQVSAQASGGTVTFSGNASGLDSTVPETVYSPTVTSNTVVIPAPIPVSEPAPDYNKQMQPVANNKITSAQSTLELLRREFASLQEKGKDVGPCKILLDLAEEYLKKAEENYQRGNYIAANYWALQATAVLEQAKKCLENL